MSDEARPRPGTIAWTDLTVPHATKVRDFYAKVVGWRPEPVDMGGYQDFNMVAPGSDQPTAGICHARGFNADIPAQWMLYIVVEDADDAAQRCREAGGEVVVRPRDLAGGRFCVVRDPAGAVCGLFALPPDEELEAETET